MGEQGCGRDRRVRWFDVDRGIGLLGRDSGEDVVVHAAALPADTPSLPVGTRVEFEVQDGPRGPVAVAVTVLAYPPPRRPRRTLDAMITLLEDLIRVLDRTSEGYRHGRRPTNSEAATWRVSSARSPTTSTAEPRGDISMSIVGAVGDGGPNGRSSAMTERPDARHALPVQRFL